MADIQLTCPACGLRQTVSEYAGDCELSCPACGKPVPLPERQSGKPGMQLKLREPFSAVEPAVPASAPGSRNNASAVSSLVAWRSSHLDRGVHGRQANALRVWSSVLLFLFLAGGLVYVRFYGGWPDVPLETLKSYGMLAVAGVYLLAIGLALRDNMFDGLLAVVVPLYPFYYLFFSSSALLVRALAGALLVAFGYDVFLYLQAGAAGVIDSVNRWIKSV